MKEQDTHAGHRARLRRRLEKEPQLVEDYEVLELLLGYGLTRKDTKPLAKELIRRFGGFRGVLDARPDELLDVEGFGTGLLAVWRLQREILARYAAAPVRERVELASPEAVAALARARLSGCPHEEVWLALLNAGNRLISWEILRRGGVDGVSIAPREVLERALEHRASGIILVHNHPGGTLTPSRADINLTEAVSRLADQMGMRLLDHVIVTEADCYSITQNRRIATAG